MFARFAWVLVAAAGTMSSAGAADLAAGPPAARFETPVTGCDCGSNMITIYDVEPGVVTRHWWADCECRYVPAARRYRQVAAPARLPEYESLIEPWRRQ